jgi:predicted RNase H-like nuclease (RuvC/YqgF family)
LKTIVKTREESISKLKAKVQAREKSMHQLRTELSEAKYNRQLLEDKIRAGGRNNEMPQLPSKKQLKNLYVQKICTSSKTIWVIT